MGNKLPCTAIGSSQKKMNTWQGQPPEKKPGMLIAPATVQAAAAIFIQITGWEPALVFWCGIAWSAQPILSTFVLSLYE